MTQIYLLTRFEAGCADFACVDLNSCKLFNPVQYVTFRKWSLIIYFMIFYISNFSLNINFDYIYNKRTLYNIVVCLKLYFEKKRNT